MKKIKKDLKLLTNSMTDVVFSCNVTASCNGHKIIVASEVMECDTTDILEHIKIVAIVNYFSKLHPEKISEAVSRMDYPDECKAWAMCTMWFAFNKSREGKPDKDWLKVYNKWDALYSKDYDDEEHRDQLLLELGLPNSWVTKNQASKRMIKKVITKVTGV